MNQKLQKHKEKFAAMLKRHAKIFNKAIPLPVLALILSLLNSLLFNIPFYQYAFEHLHADKAGFVIGTLLVLIPIVLNYLFFYLLLYLTRNFGRGFLVVLFTINALALYFISKYNVLMDRTMMGNIFNTNINEAKGFWSWKLLAYVTCIGIVPSLLPILFKINFGSFKKFLIHTASSITLLAVMTCAILPHWIWIHNQSGVMLSKILPWSYITNSIRYYAWQKDTKKPVITLPDLEVEDEERTAVVLIIGESARRDHFSLYGYDRKTTPRLDSLSLTQNIKAYNAISNATYTIAGVKSILEHEDTDDRYENLPSYLHRNGVDVIWKATNDGVENLNVTKLEDWDFLVDKYADSDLRWFDGMLIEDLCETIEECEKPKSLIVLHTNTSHGPSYTDKYPLAFGKWTPVPASADLSGYPLSSINNAYDNSILYVDYLVSSAIEKAKTIKDRKIAVIYISDHGESLGEDGIFMHGLDMRLAPPCQYEIPFIVWTNAADQKYADIQTPDQHNIFHSVLAFLGLKSPVYNADKNIFIK